MVCFVWKMLLLGAFKWWNWGFVEQSLTKIYLGWCPSLEWHFLQHLLLSQRIAFPFFLMGFFLVGLFFVF